VHRGLRGRAFSVRPGRCPVARPEFHSEKLWVLCDRSPVIVGDGTAREPPLCSDSGLCASLSPLRSIPIRPRGSFAVVRALRSRIQSMRHREEFGFSSGPLSLRGDSGPPRSERSRSAAPVESDFDHRGHRGRRGGGSSARSARCAVERPEIHSEKLWVLCDRSPVIVGDGVARAPPLRSDSGLCGSLRSIPKAWRKQGARYLSARSWSPMRVWLGVPGSTNAARPSERRPSTAVFPLTLWRCAKLRSGSHAT